MTSIKILIAHHQKRGIVKSDILCPIQTGCAGAQEIFPNMLHDDAGENISAENPKYNELSAVYWAWKNQDKLGNPEYIGLMHNRRHFLFNSQASLPDKEATWLPHSSFYLFPPITPKYQEKYIPDESIRAYFPKYDCMVIKPYDNAALLPGKKIRERFVELEDMSPDIFDAFVAAVRKLYPQYDAELDQFLSGSVQYLCNMFVMKKEYFEEYCSFLFSILKEVDSHIDSKGFSTAKLRFLGYLGEFLLTLFIFKLKKSSVSKIIEMNAAFIITPHKSEQYILWRYAIARYLTWGALRRKYQRKYKSLRKKLAILNFVYE